MSGVEGSHATSLDVLELGACGHERGGEPTRGIAHGQARLLKPAAKPHHGGLVERILRISHGV
jgi:hypothetical protein